MAQNAQEIIQILTPLTLQQLGAMTSEELREEMNHTFEAQKKLIQAIGAMHKRSLALWNLGRRWEGRQLNWEESARAAFTVIDEERTGYCGVE